MAPGAEAGGAPSEAKHELERGLSTSTGSQTLNSGWVLVNFKKEQLDEYRGMTPWLANLDLASPGDSDQILVLA